MSTQAHPSATQLLQILERGEYRAPSGAVRAIGQAQAAAEQGTRLYTPEQAAALLGLTLSPEPSGARRAHVEVTAETTQAAAQRLVQGQGLRHVAVLNFASARNPGGGFLRGAHAQEEELCRCSGLYPCQLKQPAYYQANRAQRSMLYTDHIIYSPAVPWVSVKAGELLEEPFVCGVITAPAPNAGEHQGRSDGGQRTLLPTLKRRAGMVLAVARDQGHRSLVLGAWGCGVFRNDPAQVAAAFGDWLEDERMRDSFDHVTFAIYSRAKADANLTAFRARFGAPPEA